MLTINVISNCTRTKFQQHTQAGSDLHVGPHSQFGNQVHEHEVALQFIDGRVLGTVGLAQGCSRFIEDPDVFTHGAN